MYEENKFENGQSEARYDAQTGKKLKKKNGVMRKVGMTVSLALVFGLVAGGAFTGVSYAGNRALRAFSAGNAAAGNETAQTDGALTEKTGEAEGKRSADMETEENGMVNAAYTTGSVDGKVHTVAEIAESCMPSVVSITNKGVREVMSFFGTYQQESVGAGSGIIVAENDTELLIATNNHVVSGADELSVCVGDDEEQIYPAYIKGTDSANDLAIVAVKLSDIPSDVRSGIKIAAMGSSDDLKVGEQVVAIGNALGYGQSVTSGYVSALNREVTLDNMTAELIQTDAAINPGNSGGALFNMKGEVIGINSAKFASSEVEGMGYAIPISAAEPIISELMLRETRARVSDAEKGFIGITGSDVSAEAMRMYGFPAGVYVTGVVENSGAAFAGLREGDILVSFDGNKISSMEELQKLLQYYPVGSVVKVAYMRAEAGVYTERTVNLTLGRRSRD